MEAEGSVSIAGNGALAACLPTWTIATCLRAPRPRAPATPVIAGCPRPPARPWTFADSRASYLCRDDSDEPAPPYAAAAPAADAGAAPHPAGGRFCKSNPHPIWSAVPSAPTWAHSVPFWGEAAPCGARAASLAAPPPPCGPAARRAGAPAAGDRARRALPRQTGPTGVRFRPDWAPLGPIGAPVDHVHGSVGIRSWCSWRRAAFPHARGHDPRYLVQIGPNWSRLGHLGPLAPERRPGRDLGPSPRNKSSLTIPRVQLGVPAGCRASSGGGPRSPVGRRPSLGIRCCQQHRRSGCTHTV